MTLTATLDIDDATIDVDLDELSRYGQYYIDDERDVIIRAVVYTPGTKDSRWVETTEVGIDYTITQVSVDPDEVQQYLNDELGVVPTAEEAERIAAYYQREGVEVIGDWMADVPPHRILAKADGRIASTDVEEPLRGWDDKFEDLIARIAAATELADREIRLTLLNAARSASPGEDEYSAKIELTGTPEVSRML
jgi:hypothetical protein